MMWKNLHLARSTPSSSSAPPRVQVAASKQANSSEADGSGRGQPPPPPPTVAPPPAPSRKPKERQAFRRRKKSTVERQQERESLKAAAVAESAGRQVFLSQEALVERAAAVQASAQQQQRQGHLLQPLLNLFPALNSSSRSSRGTAAGAPTLLVIDGYNLLHFHPSTKQLISADSISQARAHLHTLLKQHAAQQNVCVLVVYDAITVQQAPPQSSLTNNSSHLSPGQWTSPISDRVTALYEAGKEADTVIIDLVIDLLEQERAAAAAGRIAAASFLLCSLVVCTNDNRIQEACTAAAMQAEHSVHTHIVKVSCQGNKSVSDALQRVENKLSSSSSSSGWGVGSSLNTPNAVNNSAAGALGAGAGRLPSPEHDTLAWARHVLASRTQASAAASASQQPAKHQAAGSKHQRKQKPLTQHQQQQEQLAAAYDDEQLLRLSAASSVTGAAAAAAEAAHGASAASLNSSQLLDEMLFMDVDSLLEDV